MNKIDINTAVNILLHGGVVAHATDTCYGFACDIFNENALKRLYELKQMSFDKPVSILVSSLAEAEGYAKFSDSARELALKYWPGAITLILPRKKTLPAFLNGGVDTIGIRVPDHVISHKLVELLGRPITTTSANITRLSSPYSVAHIEAQFRDSALRPDYILDSGELPCENLPSTVIDMSEETPRIIRQGTVMVKI